MINLANYKFLTLSKVQIINAASAENTTVKLAAASEGDTGNSETLEAGAEAELNAEALAEDGTTSDVAEEDALTDEASDELIMDGAADMEAGADVGYIDEGMYMDPAYMEGVETGMMVDPSAQAPKGSLLGSWPFVIGISAAVLAVSIALGAVLARIKIKKGIELYED